MNGLRCFLIGCLAVTLSQGNGDEVFETLLNKISILDEELSLFKDKVDNQIEFNMLSLKNELKKQIKQQVKETMAEILQGESLVEVVRGYVVSEVRKLKQGHHQMKRQLHKVMKALKNEQEDKETYKEALLKGEKRLSEIDSCRRYTQKFMKLQEDLEQCTTRVNHLEAEVHNNTEEVLFLHQEVSNLKEGKESQTDNADTTDRNDEIVFQTSPSTSAVATTSPSTTINPESVRSRIIITGESQDSKEFYQLNLLNNSLTTYPFVNISYINYLSYVHKLRHLLIAHEYPKRILSLQLDGFNTTVLKEEVGTLGMAVDEERELIFLSTFFPVHSISKMSTTGKHFTVIRKLTGSYRYPEVVAVNTREKEIYTCNRRKVFKVSYDGDVLQTLVSGSRMYGLTVDSSRNILFYKDSNRLMNINLSNNISTHISTMPVFASSLAYYNNSVYYSAFDGPGTIWAVDLEPTVRSYERKSLEGYVSESVVICLVP